MDEVDAHQSNTLTTTATHHCSATTTTSHRTKIVITISPPLPGQQKRKQHWLCLLHSSRTTLLIHLYQLVISISKFDQLRHSFGQLRLPSPPWKLHLVLQISP